MAQNTWFYTFPNGKKYEIGIFHSLDGHVVIYCQGEIMVIDFNVKDDKEYSFFIENKLVKIHLERNPDNSFSYQLVEEDNSLTDNYQASKPETAHVVKAMLLFVLGVLILLMIYFFIAR